MKFQTHIDPVRQRVNVYCELPDQDGQRVFLTRDTDTHPSEIHIVEFGAEPPLWDWFPLPVVEALGEALHPRPQATERHLDDAMDVRDRLLTLIEARGLR